MLRNESVQFKMKCRDWFRKLFRQSGCLSPFPYFFQCSSVGKVMIDRCQSLWAKKYILKLPVSPIVDRKGIFISVAATRGKKLFDGVRLTVKYFFDAIDVIHSDKLFVHSFYFYNNVAKITTQNLFS